MQPDQPLVSVAITTYNRASLVGRAIESALAQTWRNLDVVVVDDGSTDDTAAVLRAHAERDSRLRIVTLAKNSGINAAKNAALDAARGEYTSLLDSDDELTPEAIATLMEMFAERTSDYGMMVCNAFDPVNGEWTGKGVTGNSDLNYEDMLCGRYSGDFTSLWRTSVMSGLRFAVDEAAREVNVWVQLYRRCKVHYRHVAIRKYFRDTPGSAVSIRSDVASSRKRLAAALSFREMFGADLARCCPQRLAELNREIVLYASFAGQRGVALQAALNACRAAGGMKSYALLCLPMLPRPILVAALRRWFAAQGAKLA